MIRAVERSLGTNLVYEKAFGFKGTPQGFGGKMKNKRAVTCDFDRSVGV